MFAISLNDVPGWLVTMPPSAIGVPVAATPGFVPHCDVLTAALPLLFGLGVVLPAGDPPLLLHPTAAVAPISASAKTAWAPDMRLYIPIPTSWW
jgi:hypothetical protein